MKKILIAAAAVALSSAPAFAANNTATQNGAATATIVAPITLAHPAANALNFGTFANAAGTIQVNADNTNSYSGPVPMGTSTTSADSFNVAGQAGASFSITTGAGTVKNGTTTIPFTTVPSVTSAALSAGGTYTFTVGGTLTLAGTEAAGAYTGSYTATVTYE